MQMVLHGLQTSPVSWLGEKNSKVHSLPSRNENELQWLASRTFALQSRGGDGVAPSSRARSPRLLWRGAARYGFQLSAIKKNAGLG